MDLCGLKWTIIIGEIGYILYIAANIKPSPALMYISKYQLIIVLFFPFESITIRLFFIQVLLSLVYLLLLYGQPKQHISIKLLVIILNIKTTLMIYLLVYFSEYFLLFLVRIPSGEMLYPISF